ncbi:MAG TPA: Gfo/Idh/MocA family oxidoreductase [Bryobacteraceae bacterium]|nr:Gfo/Idh/MocA family oxidoreductase [Bryobacteraceae bacterium]
MRLAVLGLGFMGSTHLKALSGVRGAELVAVYSQDEKKLAGDLRSVHGNLGGGGEKVDLRGITQHRQLEDVLADRDVEAIDVCLPTDLHEVVAVEALRAGKHVLVEKPMALDAYGVDRMLTAASRYKRTLMTAHVLRFVPAYVALRQVTENNRLGLLRYAMFRRRCASPGWSGWLQDAARSGGGVFDLLIHDADMCLHLFGKPDAVSATGFCDLPSGIDCIDAQLFYPHGGVVSIAGGWHHPGKYPFSMEYTVTLEGGTVDYSSTGRTATLYTPDGAATELDGGARDGYAAEIEYFVDCCNAQRAPELCPPRESADAVKLMLLLLEARNRSGRKMLCRM